MMDLVYIVRKGSRWDDNELRYSLRSAAKNLPHRNVVIVGYVPPWMRGVIHVPAADPYQHKLKNAISKIRAACESPNVSDAFLLMNDDFFVMRPTDPAIPYYHEGTIGSYMERHRTKAGYYYRAMGDTKNLLEEAELDEFNFELHLPIIFEKQKFLAVSDSINWKECGYLFRSVYCNTFRLLGPNRSDVKIYHHAGLSRQGRDFLSTSDVVAVATRFQKWIDQQFPDPSQYEIVQRRKSVL